LTAIPDPTDIQNKIRNICKEVESLFDNKDYNDSELNQCLDFLTDAAICLDLETLYGDAKYRRPELYNHLCQNCISQALRNIEQELYGN
jgi:hypothetical protein